MDLITTSKAVTRFNTYHQQRAMVVVAVAAQLISSAMIIAMVQGYVYGWLMFWKLNGRSAVIVQTLFQLEWYALTVAIYYYYLHFDDCLVIQVIYLLSLLLQRHFSYTECLSRMVDWQFFQVKMSGKLCKSTFLVNILGQIQLRYNRSTQFNKSCFAFFIYTIIIHKVSRHNAEKGK